MKRWIQALCLVLGGAGILFLGNRAVDRYWPKRLALKPTPLLPMSDFGPNGAVVRFPNRFLVAEVGRFQDELFAYLMFDYLRSRPDMSGVEVLLTYVRHKKSIEYKLLVHLPDDLLASLARMEDWRQQGLVPAFTWYTVGAPLLAEERRRTGTFLTVYNLPVYRKLERLTQAELVEFTRRFVRFKSVVDRRTRRQPESGLQPLDPEKSARLAEDIVTVADFYDLPLDFFLGIGAMENNYLNVPGDIGHTIWKRRAEKGDIVVRRRRGRVQVLNESIGAWQITRETLRHAHRLYLKDQRDYSRLPEHLRPPKVLNLEEIDPAVLTTYAGLFFRDLLDHFQGDLAKAVGAYNGGPGKPNMEYEEGVRLVASYARRVMERTAALRGQPVAEMQFFRALRTRAPPQ